MCKCISVNSCSQKKKMGPIIVVVLATHRSPALCRCNGTSWVNVENFLFSEFLVSLALKQSFDTKQHDCGVNFSIMHPVKIQSSFTIHVVDCVKSTILSSDCYFSLWKETGCSGTLQVFVNFYLKTFAASVSHKMLIETSRCIIHCSVRSMEACRFVDLCL